MFIVITLMFLLYVNVCAEGEETKAKTKLEEFYDKTGSLIITKTMEIGQIKEGKYSKSVGGKGKLETGSVKVLAAQVIDKTSGKEAFGVTLFIRHWGLYQTFIDYDEIPSLVEGMEFLLNAEETDKQDWAVSIEYRTKGGLTINAKSIGWWLAENQELGRLLGGLSQSELLGMPFVNPYIWFEDTSSIRDLKNLLLKAKEQLDALK